MGIQSSVTDCSWPFDYEFFCYPTFLIISKYNFTRKFSFERFFLSRITNDVSFLPSAVTASIMTTNSFSSPVVLIGTDFDPSVLIVVLAGIQKKG